MSTRKLLMIAAPKSGSGKTLATLALASLLARKLKIKAHLAKLGPDYLDTALHTKTLKALNTNAKSINIDPWAMRPSSQQALLARGTEPLLIESVTGLYDGARDLTASSAHFAKSYNIPVLLVLDAGGQGVTLAATLKGLMSMKPKVDIVGVILNRVSSPTHLQLIEQGFRHHIKKDRPPILGAICTNKELSMPSRYLGLATETKPAQTNPHDKIERNIESLAQQIDINAVYNSFRKRSDPKTTAKTTPKTIPEKSKALLPAPARNISIAYDEAFFFCYDAQIEAWKKSGSKVALFSPLRNETPANDAEYVYIPGGYPELYLNQLKEAKATKASLTQLRDHGATIYGECGGAAYLGQSIIDANGKPHTMLEMLPFETNYHKPKRTLGYRRLLLIQDDNFANIAPLVNYRGHEFHYGWVSMQKNTNLPYQPFWRWQSADQSLGGTEGAIIGKVGGSFIHLVDHE